MLRSLRLRAVRAALLTASVAAVTAGLLPAPASADPTPPVPIVFTDPAGLVHVTLDTGTSTQPAVWVQVSVLASADPAAAVLAGTDAGSSTEYSSGADDNRSLWTSDEPVRLPAGAAYREYPVAVDYRLVDGTVQHWTSTTTPFDYRLRTSVTGVSSDRTQLDFDHRLATVSGTVLAQDPATGRTGPAPAGLTVSLLSIGTDQSFAQATTDDQGAFHLPVTQRAQTTVVTVTQSPDGVVDLRDGYPDPIDVVTQPVRIAGSPLSVRAHAGTSVAITATVQRESATGWVPLVGADVMTAASPAFNSSVPPALGHATSDANGRVTYRVTARRTGTLLTYVTPTPYLREYNEMPSDVFVPVAPGYTGSFTLDQYGTATYRGRMSLPCPNQAVTLQYSGNGRSGWTSIGSARPVLSSSNRCGITITGNGHAHGYYRVTNPESNQLLAYAGKATYLARTVTRIASFALAPKRPSVNGRITATGVLQQVRGTSWVALRSGVVELVWKPKGDTAYYLMKTAHANSSGHFSATSKVYGDGSWALFYRADSTHLYSETKVRYVDAR